MTATHPSPSPTVTVADMNGRIAELEFQRNTYLTRCAVLAGEKALAHDLLRQASEEIARLNGVIGALMDECHPPIKFPDAP